MKAEAKRARRFNKLYHIKGDGVAEMQLQQVVHDQRFKQTIAKLANIKLSAD